MNCSVYDSDSTGQKDSAQTMQMKEQITKKYLENILPCELMVEALEQQNQEIYRLQQKYKQLKEKTSISKPKSSQRQIEESNQTESNKNPNSTHYFTKRQQQLLEIRQKQRILQRKTFVQEGLHANSKKYHEQFTRDKAGRIEQMLMKKQQVDMARGDEMNLFVSFEEGIIDELIEMVRLEDEGRGEEGVKREGQGEIKEEEEQTVQEGSNREELSAEAAEMIEVLEGWKAVYERSVGKGSSDIYDGGSGGL